MAGAKVRRIREGRDSGLDGGRRHRRTSSERGVTLVRLATHATIDERVVALD